MRFYASVHFSMRPLLLGLSIVASLVACTDASAPQSPTAPASGATTQTSSSEYTSTSTNEDDYADDSDDNSALLGADVGTEDMKAAVTKCNKKGKFYDRYADEGAGKCLTAKLAKTTCSIDNLKSLLKGAEKTSFVDAMDTSYDGFEIDQCLDCPKGNSIELCMSSDGVRQVGTKAFFVKEEAEELVGKARWLSITTDTSSSE